MSREAGWFPGDAGTQRCDSLADTALFRARGAAPIRRGHASPTGFSHCTKMVPVKSHNDFSRPLVENGVV